jgi:hypothetical protein
MLFLQKDDIIPRGQAKINRMGGECPVSGTDHLPGRGMRIACGQTEAFKVPDERTPKPGRRNI